MTNNALAFHPESAASVIRWLGPTSSHGDVDLSTYSRVHIFRDDQVAESVSDPILKRCSDQGVECSQSTLEAGESLKDLQGVQRILDQMAHADLDRASAVIAVGGGSLGDAVGFAASVWNRGISWFAVPTTLLAMVDAHLGGKTAVHFAGIKNRLGSFHLPREVWVHPDSLETLPLHELRQGWAEIIKAALIGGGSFLHLLEEELPQGLRPSTDVIRQAMAVKVDVVNSDLRESGRRRILNLGHTLAHALEMEWRDGEPLWAHGEAVSMGLVFACFVSEKMGFATEPLLPRISSLLESAGLPLRPTEFPDAELLLDRIEKDKKSRGGVVSWILPQSPGQVKIHELDRDGIRESLTDWIQQA